MSCPDCDGVARREFLKAAALGGAGLVAAGAFGAVSRFTGSSETLVTTLYNSLTAEQKKKIAFSFDDPLRSKVDNNWMITPFKIVQFFTADQQAMIDEIFRGLHNPEFIDKVMYHIQEDAGGLGEYSVALFGTPGTGAFEFVLAGRHCTVRCDGDSVAGAAFGGPVFYGPASQRFDGAPDPPKKVYWYQAKRANQAFPGLVAKQRTMALLVEPR